MTIFLHIPVMNTKDGISVYTPYVRDKIQRALVDHEFLNIIDSYKTDYLFVAMDASIRFFISASRGSVEAKDWDDRVSNYPGIQDSILQAYNDSHGNFEFFCDVLAHCTQVVVYNSIAQNPQPPTYLKKLMAVDVLL